MTSGGHRTRWRRTMSTLITASHCVMSNDESDRKDDKGDFDLVVIGTGEGGSSPAFKCRNAGWRVAVVDEQPFGGTCALRGCDPKKVLVGGAEVVAWHRRMAAHGVTGGARLSWPALMDFKNSFTKDVPAKREDAYRKSGIETLHGEARFVSRNHLAVGERTVRAKHIVVAAGARPRPLGIPGEEWLITSTDFLELAELPRRVVLVGAGYIAFEFAHIAARAGASVIIVGRTPLARFDETLVERLVAYTREIGVDVRLGAEVVAIERRDDALRLVCNAHGSEFHVDADVAVHGAGRVPSTAGLDADRGGITLTDGGAIKVNDYLQSVTNPAVYAAGDVARPPGKLPLTPVAAHEGAIVASNLLKGASKKPDYRGTPSVVFTIPPLASVGLSEKAARALGREITVKAEDTTSWYSNRRTRAPVGFFKTIVDTDAGTLLGAHLLGEGAAEAINVFALAVRLGLPVSDVKHALYAYPTVGADLPYML